jgi:hypothetical protein
VTAWKASKRKTKVSLSDALEDGDARSDVRNKVTDSLRCLGELLCWSQQRDTFSRWIVERRELGIAGDTLGVGDSVGQDKECKRDLLIICPIRNYSVYTLLVCKRFSCNSLQRKDIICKHLLCCCPLLHTSL